MKKRMKLLLSAAAGVLSLMVSGILPAQENPDLTFEQLQAIAVQPAKYNEELKTTAMPAMLTLFKEETLIYTSQSKYKETPIRYRLHVPAGIEKGKTYPLILWLHGAGETGDNNMEQLTHLHHMITYLTGPKKLDFFLLVPQAPNDHAGWGPRSIFRTEPVTRTVTVPVTEAVPKPKSSKNAVSSLFSSLITLIESETAGPQTTPASAAGTTDGKKQAMKQVTVTEYVTVEDVGEDFSDSPLGFSFAMIDQVRENYPIDPDRITVSGLSTGGDGTWRALEYGADLFAAGVPLVSWSTLRESELARKPNLKKIPIWAIYSSDDHGIESARENFAKAEAAGCNVKKSEFGLCGHNAWTPAMLQADIFSWLLSRGKKDGEYVSLGNTVVNPDDLQGIIEVAERDSRLPTLAPPNRKTPGEETGQVPSIALPGSTLPPPGIIGYAQSPSLPAQGSAPRQVLPLNVEQIVVTRSGGDATSGTSGGTGVRIAGPPRSPQLPITLKDKYYTKLIKAYFDHFSNSDHVSVSSLEKASELFNRLSLQAKWNLLDEVFQKDQKDMSYLQPLQWDTLAQWIDRTDAAVPPKTYSSENLRRINDEWREFWTPSNPDAAEQAVPQAVNSPDVTAAVSQARQQAQTSVETVKEVIKAASQASSETPSENATVRRVIEECEKEWEMSTTTLYGLFASGWNKESELVPDYVRTSTAQQLADKIIEIATNSKTNEEFDKLCDSVLKLDNQPMSSPWFETGGGRLKDDIRYTLSPRGRILMVIFVELSEMEGDSITIPLSDDRNYVISKNNLTSFKNRIKQMHQVLVKIEEIVGEDEDDIERTGPKLR
ncbi:MAG: hypothetical protein LBQ54_16275 [Planctomycetaceae bacterium]|jgi:predicted peptidase|nr:hypothetical protein [Planctomycetaceae bacterium]